MPPYEPVSRIYVQRFMAILHKYGLQLTLVETRDIEKMLAVDS